MKNLLTFLILFSAATTSYAQNFDVFIGAGLYSDKPTDGSSTYGNFGTDYVPQRGNGSYVAAGTDWVFGGDVLAPGLRLEADYINYKIKSTVYNAPNGIRVLSKGVTTDEMKIVRFAPSFTINSSISDFRISLGVGPDYSWNSAGNSKFFGVHGVLRAGYKAVMVNVGYAHGMGSLMTRGAFTKDDMASRAFFAGVSLHLLSLFR